MPKIVCIDLGTYKAGLNNIGDIAEVHNNKVELLGPGYIGFKIIKIETITDTELYEKLSLKKPDQAISYSLVSPQGKLTLKKPIEKEVWKNSAGKWCFLEKRPLYALNIGALTSDELNALANPDVTKAIKFNLLDKCVDTISLDNSNLTEASDLNG